MLRDTSFEQFEVFPITGALGAEVRGIDLAAKPDDASFEDLRRALHQYGVLAVRDQHLPPPAFHAVARRFGPFSGNPVHTPIDGYEDVVRFVREPDDTGKVIGEEWHMDLAWMAKPPGITLLFGEVIPPLGGDTCFASLEHTYRSLTPRMQELLAGLTGIHSGKGVVAVNAVHKHLGIRQDATRVDDIETEHPVVCVHPVTGRLRIGYVTCRKT
jgi:taurine dioxygenase